MSRKPREKSALGIYHVMLRGINKYNIFFDEKDYLRMMQILHDIPFKKNNYTGEIESASQCTIYAYCLLDNHIHILIKEGDIEISDIMKSIGDRYAMYINKKYERVGHLFQSRFASEAINDAGYFRTVLRYIARNPVKAKEANSAAEYPYSSWNEYVNAPSNIMRVLKFTAIQAVLEKFPLQDLSDWINEDNNDRCLDIDSFDDVKSDKEAWGILSNISQCINPEDFRRLDIQTQLYYIFEALSAGVKVSQAARLGSITRYQILKALKRKEERNSSSSKVGDTSTTGTVPVGKEKVGDTGDLTSSQKEDMGQEVQDRVRQIPGLSKKSYHQLHLIVEYLSTNSPARCQNISEYIGRGAEQTRKLLVLLANEDIIIITGRARGSYYSLKV